MGNVHSTLAWCGYWLQWELCRGLTQHAWSTQPGLPPALSEHWDKSTAVIIQWQWTLVTGPRVLVSVSVLHVHLHVLSDTEHIHLHIITFNSSNRDSSDLLLLLVVLFVCCVFCFCLYKVCAHSSIGSEHPAPFSHPCTRAGERSYGGQRSAGHWPAGVRELRDPFELSWATVRQKGRENKGTGPLSSPSRL